jgi:hypothetical protein
VRLFECYSDRGSSYCRVHSSEKSRFCQNAAKFPVLFNLSDLYFANSVLVEMIAEILAQNDGISGSLRTISNNMYTWPLQIPSYITQRNPHRLRMEKENRKT